MGRYTEHHTVDRLDLDGRAMYIADLGQAPAGGVILLLFGGQALLQFLPVGFGRGQRVVAVADSQHHGRLTGGTGPASSKFFLVGQVGQCGVDLVDQGGVFHRPAAQMAAAQHQLAVIQQRQAIFMVTDGFDQRLFLIVSQHHHVGRFQNSATAYFQARRDALHHRLFAGADGRFAAGVIVVGFQVHGTYQPLADGAVHLGALHIDKAVDTAGQHRLAVLLHRAADGLHPLLLLGGAQVSFGQDDMQRAGLTGGQRFGALPVLRLGSKLVYRNAGPRVQRNVGGGQQNISGNKARNRHTMHLFLLLLQNHRMTHQRIDSQ